MKETGAKKLDEGTRNQAEKGRGWREKARETRTASINSTFSMFPLSPQCCIGSLSSNFLLCFKPLGIVDLVICAAHGSLTCGLK